jgi:hypothetical protein
MYYNAGDWVETCSALVEEADGTIEVVYQRPPHPFSQPAVRPLPLPAQALL